MQTIFDLGLRNIGKYRGNWPAQFCAAKTIGARWLQVDGIAQDQEETVSELIKETGIRLWSITALNCAVLGPDTARSSEEQMNIAATIRQAAKMGARCVSVFAGNLPTEPPEKVAEQIGKIYGPLAALASDQGVLIAVENCPMISATLPQTPSNFAYCPAHWRLMWQAVDLPSFGLELDFGHLPALDIDPVRAVNELGKRIHHVGVKDAIIDEELLFEQSRLGRGYCAFRPPGLGSQPIPEIIKALAAVGYKGPLTLDHINFATDDVPMYQAAADYLRSLGVIGTQ